MATPIPPNEARFSIDEIAQATRGVVRRAGPTEVKGVAIDSRAVVAGGAFVAVRGASHDAHRFVPDVAKNGAAVVVIAKDAHLDVPEGPAVIEVDDTLVALGDLALAHRRKITAPVIAITGSQGKTGTKDLTAAALEGVSLTVHRTAGNLNNLFGLPMTLLAAPLDIGAVVLEAGMSVPGEMARLAQIAEADVAVVTSVAAVHTAGVGGIEGVAREKAALMTGAKALVTSKDHDLLDHYAARAQVQTKLTFGRSPGATVRLVSHLSTERGTSAAYEIDGRTIEVELTLLGVPSALNAAAALGVVCALGLDVDAAARALGNVKPSGGRLCPLHGVDDVLVLDDSYNASPAAVAFALDTAMAIGRDRSASVIVVLGDMRELEDSELEHAQVGKLVARSGARIFVACGDQMVHAAAAAMRSSSPSIEVHHLRDPEDAIMLVTELRERGDVILVKGSRSMHMERVVAAFVPQEDAP